MPRWPRLLLCLTVVVGALTVWLSARPAAWIHMTFKQGLERQFAFRLLRKNWHHHLQRIPHGQRAFRSI